MFFYYSMLPLLCKDAGKRILRAFLCVFPDIFHNQEQNRYDQQKEHSKSHTLGIPDKKRNIPAVSADKTKQASAGSRRLFLYIRRTAIPAIQRIAVKKGKGFAYPTAVRSK